MKKSILFLASVCMITMVSCADNTPKKASAENLKSTTEHNINISNYAVMKFTETNHDFGTINEGDIVNHKFTFTNTGEVPLVILNAKGSCGCTVSKWSKEPIAPGATGELLVSFNSNGKPNLQNKQVTITANTEKGKEILKIKAMVTPKTKTTSGIPVSK
ncbi:DUF1573 domain-containing protein [Aquimarina longa]|uniref:DUF1573 domain-containing protein n=1 Tax=Aquimarina longa TaxID=1080221 RepID=UPI0007836419|nr:DUF1573 domain-containing protein [Aquimarina longa]